MIFQTEFFIKLDSSIFSPDFDGADQANLDKVFRMYFDNPIAPTPQQPSPPGDNVLDLNPSDPNTSPPQPPPMTIVRYVSQEHLTSFQSRNGIYQVIAFLINAFLLFPE